jgi:hypothetical protein
MSSSTSQQRRCSLCRGPLAADNRAAVCSPCGRRLSAAAQAPQMPDEFWERPELQAAFKQQRFGAVVAAYRHALGGAVTQARMAGWLSASGSHLSQEQVSRIERRRSAVNDLRKLDRWARALRIPQRYLWFALSDPTSDASTGQQAGSTVPATSDSACSGDSEGDNVRRRELLLRGPGAGLAVIADSSPAGSAAGPAAGRPVTARPAVGMTDVETVRAMTNTFRSLDNKFGGGHSRSQVNAYLNSIVDPMVRNGRYTDTVKVELFSATGELHQLIGWMAYDTGQASIGHRHLRAGLRLCQEVGNNALAAEMLAGMSHHAAFAGAPETAVDLALGAHQAANMTAIGALRSEAAVMEAHGLALEGDKTSCLAALRKAEQEFGVRGRDVPAWLSYFDEAYLAAKFAHVFRDLRLPEEAERFARKSLEMVDGYERGRLFNTAVLAASLADQGRVDEACAMAMRAVDMAGAIRSIRIVVYLSDVARRLAPFRATVDVRGLYERMADAGIPVG